MTSTKRSGRLLAASALALAFVASACGSSKTVAKPAATTAAPKPAAVATTAAPAKAAAPTGDQFNQALFDALPAAMKASKVMTLATDPTDPPLEFMNDKNELVGSEVDLAAALGKILGIEVKLVPSKFDAIIPGVEAGRFDGSVSGFADRKERQKIVDFVDYMTTSRGILLKKGAHPELATKTELCGLKVAVAKGTTMADSIVKLGEECVAGGKGAIDGQVYPDQSACVLAVQSGRADITIFSAHAALWIAKNSDNALEVFLRPKEGNDINGIVLKKGELAPPVQKAIQQLMDAGTFKDIFTKWGLQGVILTTATVNAGTN
jgi:polar amino acid transport system substrate-binding protein